MKTTDRSREARGVKLFTVELSADLHTRLKIKSAREHKTMTEAVTELIENYVKSKS